MIHVCFLEGAPEFFHTYYVNNTPYKPLKLLEAQDYPTLLLVLREYPHLWSDLVSTFRRGDVKYTFEDPFGRFLPIDLAPLGRFIAQECPVEYVWGKEADWYRLLVGPIHEEQWVPFLGEIFARTGGGGEDKYLQECVQGLRKWEKAGTHVGQAISKEMERRAGVGEMVEE